MSFWSGETLAARLPTLIAPFDSERLDCAAYRLGVGEQAFVTSEKLEETSANPELVTFLDTPPKNLLRIPPGQFAFVLTEETVEVPADAIALISMRATYKFKGLINVSGFTVDAGWKGKLLFSVYNAGPAPVLLHRSEEVFMIVYAALDRETQKLYKGKSQNQKSIKTNLLSGMNAQVFSPQVLKARLDEVHDRLSKILLWTTTTTGIAASIAVITGIVIATVALLPSWVGVVVARTLDAANYEIRQKADAAPSIPTALTASGAQSTVPVKPVAGTSGASTGR